MHARTFELAMEKVYAAEEIVDQYCDLLIDRLRGADSDEAGHAFQ